VCVFIYVTAEITIEGNHQIRPTNPFFGMKTQCYLDRAMKKRGFHFHFFTLLLGIFHSFSDYPKNIGENGPKIIKK